MAGRRLSADERALWARLARSVRPIRASVLADATFPQPAPDPVILEPKTAVMPAAVTPKAAPRRPALVLDDGWEKQIKRGQLVPELAIDLHGHTLSAAHARLEQALQSARGQGVRVMLVVTGKPRKAIESGGSGNRGAIRAEITHWLDSSPHADAIASVRNAHPRHGGEGALYIILRRKK